MSCQHNTLQFCWRNKPWILKGKYQKIYEESFSFGVFFLTFRLILMMIMTFSNSCESLSNAVLILKSNLHEQSMWWVGLMLWAKSLLGNLSQLNFSMEQNPHLQISDRTMNVPLSNLPFINSFAHNTFAWFCMLSYELILPRLQTLGNGEEWIEWMKLLSG